MIDLDASEATFANPHRLARDVAAAVMRWERVPDIALFRRNTAAFVHQMVPAAISNVDGESDYIRVEVLTPVGVLDREKQLRVVKELTEIVAAAAGPFHLPANVGLDLRVTRGWLGHWRSRQHRG